MRSVSVLDYAFARSRRLMLALTAAGFAPKLLDSPLSVKTADVLVLPDGDDHDTSLARGVSSSLFDAVANHIDSGKPLVCVGLSLCFLLDGQTHPAMPKGLRYFAAPVQRFDPRMTDDTERPLLCPHVGPSLVVGLDRHPALSLLVPKGEPGVWMAFRHRLCAPSRVPQADVAVCHHGVPFAGAIWRNNVVGLQFLPEHSSRLGIDLLRAVISR